MNQENNKNFKIVQNEFGFYEVSPKPSDSELIQYYNQKYFLNEKTQYQASYTKEESDHKYIKSREAEHFALKKGRMLDIGCGEGYSLNYFAKAGWDVTGIDFTIDGVQYFFPELVNRVRVGNLFEEMNKIISSNEKYDLILCENVLEHVRDPFLLLNGIKKILSPNGICRFVVPNDNSLLQKYLVNKNLAEPDYWVIYPDHLNYFDATSFKKVLESENYSIHEMLTEFPIDLFLLNPDSHFKADPSKGRNCHKARVQFENMLSDVSIENLIEFRKGCARAGVGRNIIAYCQVKK